MTTKEFLKPTRKKVMLFFIITAALIVVTVILFIINERDLAGIVLYPFTTLPVTLFDATTGGAFRPKECFVLCFPTLPQAAFILLFDIAIIYVVSCVIVALKKQPSQKPLAGRLPAGRQGPPQTPQ